MTHKNAPLSVEGRRRLVERCRTRPIAHVAAEMGISRACASKWVNRYRRHGDPGLLDRSSAPHRQPTTTAAEILARIEELRRAHKWSAARIAFELTQAGIPISRRTVSRHLAAVGLNRRRFLDPTGEVNRTPQRIQARRPGHMVHVDVKKVGRIPDGGGWRAHGRGSEQAKAVNRRKKKSERGGYVYLHSAIDGYSRLASTEALPDEKAATAIAFLHRARAWFAAHGISHIERIVHQTHVEAEHRAHSFNLRKRWRARLDPARVQPSETMPRSRWFHGHGKGSPSVRPQGVLPALGSFSRPSARRTTPRRRLKPSVRPLRQPAVRGADPAPSTLGIADVRVAPRSRSRTCVGQPLVSLPPPRSCRGHGARVRWIRP